MFRVLIVEDNAINQRVAQVICERAGFEVEVVSDGLQAVEACRCRVFDAILMDLQMPSMDGLEASREIRNLTGAQPVIIAVTANAFCEVRERCLNIGMDDFVSRPFRSADLTTVLKTLIGTRTLRDAPCRFDREATLLLLIPSVPDLLLPDRIFTEIRK